MSITEVDTAQLGPSKEIRVCGRHRRQAGCGEDGLEELMSKL